MRAAFFCTLVAALCLTAALPARAQDGAPVPLTDGDATESANYMPEGYVPLPEGAEGEVPALADETQAEDVVPSEDVAATEEAAPLPVTDPMVECTAQAGVDYEGKPVMDKISSCLKERHALSESAMETAAIEANTRMQAEGRNAVRALTSSNLAFVAYRDTECLRRRNATADAEAARQVEWACRASMNDARGQTLQAQ